MGLSRYTFLTDVHGDMQDASAVNAAIRFVADFKPKYRVCGGDTWDFRALRGKASEEERRESLAADFEAGMNFLEVYRPTHLLLGNHCGRLWELAKKDNGPASDYAQGLVARVESLAAKLRCPIFPYHKRLGVLKIGRRSFLHGFFTGVSAARQHALCYGECTFGHVHCSDEHAVPGIERRVAQSVGSLSVLDFDYDAKSPGSLRHSQGFGYGGVDEKTGATSAFRADRIDGAFHVASEIRAVAA